MLVRSPATPVVVASLALTPASCVGPSATSETKDGELASIVRPTGAREFRFRPGHSIAGVVVSEIGRPERNRGIQALAPPASRDAECWGAFRTGDDGRFEIRDLPPGRYALRLWHGDWGSGGTGPSWILIGGDDVEAGRKDVRLVLSIERHP